MSIIRNFPAVPALTSLYGNCQRRRRNDLIASNTGLITALLIVPRWYDTTMSRERVTISTLQEFSLSINLSLSVNCLKIFERMFSNRGERYE